jgi:hypothetical protein
VSSLAWEVFGQHKLRCILSYSWHDAGMVNIYLDKCCLIDGMGGFSSTRVEMYYVRAFLIGFGQLVKIHFLSKLAWEAFGQLKLRYILFPR